MTNYCKSILNVALCAGLLAGAAQATDQPGDKYVSLMAGGIVPDSARDADTGFAGGSVTIGQVFRERWNIEGQFGFLNIGGDSDEGGLDQDQIFFSANVLNIYNRGGPAQPYLLGGVGYQQTSIYGRSDDNGFQATLGGGVMVPIFDDSTRLRAEALGRFQSGDESYTDWLINLGVSFPFGKKAEPMPAAVVVPAVPSDSDKDGVADSIDRCPATPANETVDQYGCSLDADRDGVADALDRCWDTPLNTPVAANGCSTGAGAVQSFAVPQSGVIELPGVTFRTNSDILLDGASAMLDTAAVSLLENPDMVVEVAGHTDSEGDSAINADLSESRALAVRDYLIARGVAPSRITARGYGDAEPVADNATAAGRAANRRVELRVLNGQ